jgi:phosphoribosylformylglycinamidine (FGAM) synthase PurS component
MSEYEVQLQVTFEADNHEDAEAVVVRLCERVLEHPNVLAVEQVEQA